MLTTKVKYLQNSLFILRAIDENFPLWDVAAPHL